MRRRSEEIFDEFLQSLSKDERDLLRRIVGSASRHIHHAVSRHGRYVHGRIRHGANRVNNRLQHTANRIHHHAHQAAQRVGRFVGSHAQLLKVVRALRSLGSKALDIAGLNFHHDIRDIRAILRSKSIRFIEGKIVKLIVRNMCGRVLEKNPTVGPAFTAMKANAGLTSKVNMVFRKLSGISIEDQFQRLGRKILNRRALRFIPYHNRRIPILGRTVAQQIESLRSQIMSAVLSRYGLGNGLSRGGGSRRRSGGSRRRSGGSRRRSGGSRRRSGGSSRRRTGGSSRRRTGGSSRRRRGRR